MINYDEIINLARTQGKSLEDIAKEFSAALNEAAKPKITPEEKYLDELRDAFTVAIESETIDLETAIGCVVLCVAENHPHWKVDDIDTFKKGLESNIDTNMRLVDCAAKGGNVNVGATALELLLEAIEESSSKSKSKSEKSGCTCGRQVHRSDDEILEKFLGGLGL